MNLEICREWVFRNTEKLNVCIFKASEICNNQSPTIFEF